MTIIKNLFTTMISFNEVLHDLPLHMQVFQDCPPSPKKFYFRAFLRLEKNFLKHCGRNIEVVVGFVFPTKNPRVAIHCARKVCITPAYCVLVAIKNLRLRRKADMISYP